MKSSDVKITKDVSGYYSHKAEYQNEVLAEVRKDLDDRKYWEVKLAPAFEKYDTRENLYRGCGPGSMGSLDRIKEWIADSTS